ncbi:hypothetical protein M8I34_25710 [Streptomyces sp. MCA2]|uniref:hypothetical protein n=1 Tax=Streptomyces sp. MCA2 TaxID=2944805 RepID=UPI00202111E0|nr:hypothetical protein [Streptomyces sp. MCA2]MCL7494772.1 hypothetical protein [Streptomyces sp. MCA2]
MADLLTPHLHSGGPGPERKITVLGLLVGLHLACAGSGGQRVHLAEAARILGWWIPAQARERLGITDVPAVETASAFEALEGRVRRLFHDIETVCDPSPLPKNRRLDREEAQRLRDADAPERAERARQLLTAVCNQILEASLTPVRPCLTAGWAGSCAVDGTAFATFARGVKTTGALTATDPDAGWYVRDGDHHDPDTLPGSGSGSGKKRSRRSRRVKMLFGYETTLEIVAPTVLHPAAGLPAGTRPPAVILAMSTNVPGADPGGGAVRALADATCRRGYPAGTLAADWAFNNSVPETFQLPVRELGFTPVYDYPRDALGVQEPGPGGASLLEGSWTCPHTPAELKDATPALHRQIDAAGELGSADAPKAREQAREDWVERITARQDFLLAPKGAADADGYRRWRCPAEAGTVRCPLKPRSLEHYRAGAPLLDPEPGPGGTLKLCAQGSITIGPEAGSKHWQPLPFGTPAWQQAYHLGRSSVEGGNGHAKDGAFENIADARGRRVRGHAAQSILLAFQLAHANTRKITNWKAALPQNGREPTRRPPRRKKPPNGSWTPRGYTHPTLSPDTPPHGP